MEKGQSTKQLFKGALLLTLAGLISKVFSAGYRIPLQNITGDVGFYIYQQIYPILGIATMLGLYGFPVAISREVAKQKEQDGHLTTNMFNMLILLIIFNGLLFIGMYLSASSIAVWMGDLNLVGPIKVAAFIFLLIPFLSFFRGMFQGLNNMKPTALSQVAEQLIRVGIIIFIAIFLVKQGYNIYWVGTGAALGSILGAFFSTLVLFYIWKRKKTIHVQRFDFNVFSFMKAIIIYGLIISINHMILLLFQFVDAFTLVPNLITFGESIEEAKVWKGIFDRAQPLIQLGAVLGSSFALALVPSVTEKRMKQFPNLFHSHLQSAIKFSFLLSVGATVGLITIFPYANTLLFLDNKGSGSLELLTITIFFASLVITTASILQGLGYVKATAGSIIVGVLVKWILNISLIPTLHINGSAIATVLSSSIILLLNLIILKKVLPSTKLFVIPWRTFLLSISGMVIFLFIMNGLVTKVVVLTTRLDYLVYVLCVSIVGALIYLFLLVKYNGFTKEELRALPFGEQLSRLNRQ
ncbi:putative polysaccharide biosynthesis protein [Aquibacillus sediminis]|uniref:putative polysaccharide biosynthesis protein n=1 Tax=Aquibacillus sediminis TaxID=2574734 RepID=UPI00110852F5|nr:oligosaccharide flippase family protein [Aquibacillus sediminis]